MIPDFAPENWRSRKKRCRGDAYADAKTFEEEKKADAIRLDPKIRVQGALNVDRWHASPKWLMSPTSLS